VTTRLAPTPTGATVFVAVCARKTRIIDVVYNASNNELVRTKTLVKGAIVEVDSTPFRDWFEKYYHFRIPIKGKEEGGPIAVTGKDGKTPAKVAARQAKALARLADERFRDQFVQGRLLASISSRPGQSGRADGYLLEGKELEFYSRQLSLKKKK
jgi:small subunit ribosomal protein S8e